MIKFLIFLFVFFFLVYHVTRILFRPFIFFAGQRRSGGNFDTENNSRTGDIKIDYVPKKKRNTPKDEGEYVDFKEVD